MKLNKKQIIEELSNLKHKTVTGSLGLHKGITAEDRATSARVAQLDKEKSGTPMSTDAGKVAGVLGALGTAAYAASEL